MPGSHLGRWCGFVGGLVSGIWVLAEAFQRCPKPAQKAKQILDQISNNGIFAAQPGQSIQKPKKEDLSAFENVEEQKFQKDIVLPKTARNTSPVAREKNNKKKWQNRSKG